jgi:hypothetical protein
VHKKEMVAYPLGENMNTEEERLDLRVRNLWVRKKGKSKGKCPGKKSHVHKTT